jgi:hypothetical protein
VTNERLKQTNRFRTIVPSREHKELLQRMKKYNDLTLITSDWSSGKEETRLCPFV